MKRLFNKFTFFSALAILILSTLPALAALTPSNEHVLKPGEPVNLGDFPESRFLTLSGDILLRGETVALSRRFLRTGTETTLTPLPDDRVTFVRRGTVEKMIDGSFVQMHERDLVYEEADTETALTADGNTAEILSFRWIGDTVGTSPPMIPAGRIINRDYLQWCFPAGEREMVKVVQGRRGQMCFVRLDPGKTIPDETQPGETLFLVLRGGMTVTLDGRSLNVAANDVLLIGGGMSASFKPETAGCDYFMITTPAREKYTAALRRRIDSFHAVFPTFVQPEIAVDGRFGSPRLSFIEGPNWINGRFYFTDMSVGGMYRIEPGGVVTTLNLDILPCGMALMPGGTIAVCDIENNTIVEMTPEGLYARTLVSTFNGKPLPGTPNDVICDSRGGLYFTVMSFARPPGSNIVMYRSPDGSLIEATEPGDFGIPNGCALSPDGTILYVNDDTKQYVRACDVLPDGTLGERRPFARLISDETVLGMPDVKTFADGMTVDADGNLYVCASGFVQVFDSEGSYRGGFVLPKPAFHLAFGGDDGSTLYVSCLNVIYTIGTKVKGLEPAWK